MKSNDTRNPQSDNRPTNIKNLGRTSREDNKEKKDGNRGTKKSFKNDKIGRSKNRQIWTGDCVDVLKFENLAYFTPASREFMNCDLETVYQHYLKIIRDVFGINPKHFIDKANLKKKINYLVQDEENLLEIVRFLNKFQDEI